MKIELCVQDWEQVRFNDTLILITVVTSFSTKADDTSNRILAIEPRNLEGLKFKVLQLMCRKGQYEDASIQLRKLLEELQRVEQKNAIQFRHNAQLFSRICGRENHILEGKWWWLWARLDVYL